MFARMVGRSQTMAASTRFRLGPIASTSVEWVTSEVQSRAARPARKRVCEYQFASRRAELGPDRGGEKKFKNGRRTRRRSPSSPRWTLALDTWWRRQAEACPPAHTNPLLDVVGERGPQGFSLHVCEPTQTKLSRSH